MFSWVTAFSWYTQDNWMVTFLLGECGVGKAVRYLVMQSLRDWERIRNYHRCFLSPYRITSPRRRCTTPGLWFVAHAKDIVNIEALRVLRIVGRPALVWWCLNAHRDTIWFLNERLCSRIQNASFFDVHFKPTVIPYRSLFFMSFLFLNCDKVQSELCLPPRKAVHLQA